MTAAASTAAASTAAAASEDKEDPLQMKMATTTAEKRLQKREKEKEDPVQMGEEGNSLVAEEEVLVTSALAPEDPLRPQAGRGREAETRNLSWAR